MCRTCRLTSPSAAAFSARSLAQCPSSIAFLMVSAATLVLMRLHARHMDNSVPHHDAMHTAKIPCTDLWALC